MMDETPAEETGRTGDSSAIRRREELLQTSDIQGNIVPGFNKDYQAFVFLKFLESDADHASFRGWLRLMLPFVSTCRQVLAFNRLYKRIERREQTSALSRQDKPQTVQATW